MKIKYQADNDLDLDIVEAVLHANPALDFQLATAVGLHLGVPDDQVLEIAAHEERILVSHDLRTMPRHFAQFIVNHTSHGVIILSRKLSIGQAAFWLNLIWEASEAEEYVNRIHRIPW